MTERGLPIVDGAPTCPFVAFEDDRDQRASSPDHRHRCYADSPPAPRALAHQEAYCLSSAFPVCPIFQDWARREAAQASDDGRPAVPAEVEEHSQALPPRRAQPREWTAPPPWREDAHDQPVELDSETPPPFVAGRGQPGQGLAGSAADRLAGGERAPSTRRTPDWGWGTGEGDAEPRSPDPGAGALWGHLTTGDHVEAAQPSAGEWSEVEEATPRRAARTGFGLPISDRRPRVGQARPRRATPRDESAPSWERPRRYEAYPSLRTRVGIPSISLPPLALATIAIVVAALALFFLPALLGVGSPSAPIGGASPSASPSAAPSASLAPTASPEPTQQVYVVVAGDTLSSIANRFDVTVDQILAANPEIENPNRIAVGDEIVIPDPQASAPPELEGESAAPSG
jgi:hypothetical protein